jgi:type II secretory pathway pseudopilin PulG
MKGMGGRRACGTSGDMLGANVTTLVVAIVGIAGTLASPLIAQRYARQQRLEDREETRRMTSLLDRRQNYTALHTAAWDFRRALKNCLFDAGDLDELESVRQAFMTNYRNTQIISTDPVLGAAVPVYDELTDAYGLVKKLPPGASAAGGERRAVQHTLNTTVEDAIRHMRTGSAEPRMLAAACWRGADTPNRIICAPSDAPT